MKKNILSFLKVLLVSMMLVGCSSCDDPYVDINYNLVCSEDLLEYATPQVTYTANNSDPVIFDITEGEWVEVNNNNEFVKTTVVINGDTITKESKLMKWTKHVHYKDFSVVDDEMTITYKSKQNASDIIVMTEKFYHNLSAELEILDDDGNKRHPTFYRQNININIGQAKSLSEIIRNYKDRYGFHVESNGRYETKE